MNEEYIARINRVFDYIDTHLQSELSLQELAKVACFSQYHFHRIFRAMMGEPLNRFIQRLRLEKAATQLLQNPKKSITEIALDCGFSSSATFARSFKEHFDMSASQWRGRQNPSHSKMCKTNSKKGQQLSNQGKAFELSPGYIDPITQNLKWRVEMKDKPTITANVEVKDMPALHVAYVRNVGPYKGNSNLFEELFTKLMMWAGPRGLMRPPETQCLSIYHDNPDITNEDKLRTSVCITVPKGTEVGGEIGAMEVASGKYAVARFELASDEYPDAWNAVYGGWMPQSGFQPDDAPPFELYHNNPKEHPEGKCVLDICIPVKPL